MVVIGSSVVVYSTVVVGVAGVVEVVVVVDVDVVSDSGFLSSLKAEIIDNAASCSGGCNWELIESGLWVEGLISSWNKW